MESTSRTVSTPQALRLTPAECDVLAVSATGRVVSEVAEVLGHPPETVRRALDSAVNKLGARSKLEAVLLALRAGVIREPLE